MNNVPIEELIQVSMQRDLTPEEESRLEAWLAAHPEQRTRWAEERAISRALRRIPDVPVSSNFTAGVWEKIELEGRREARAERAGSWWRGLLPRLSFAAVAAVLAVAGLKHYQTGQQTALVVKDLSHDLSLLSDPEVLRDFEAIEQLRQISVSADEELLSAIP